jgi:hypothetical protein
MDKWLWRDCPEALNTVREINQRTYSGGNIAIQFQQVKIMLFMTNRGL